jgi:hypothetical protein
MGKPQSSLKRKFTDGSKSIMKVFILYLFFKNECSLRRYYKGMTMKRDINNCGCTGLG